MSTLLRYTGTVHTRQTLHQKDRRHVNITQIDGNRAHSSQHDIQHVNLTQKKQFRVAFDAMYVTVYYVIYLIYVTCNYDC
jgi:hypothetical protein